MTPPQRTAVAGDGAAEAEPSQNFLKVLDPHQFSEIKHSLNQPKLVLLAAEAANQVP